MKDCFGLHGHSAFGSAAKEKSGVGQQSLLSQVQLTDLVHWLQVGKTVDISRYASEINRLAFRLPHCLGCFAACGPSPPTSGQANYRLPPLIALPLLILMILLVVIVIADESNRGTGAGVVIIVFGLLVYRDWRQSGFRSIYGCYTAIGNFETFDDSRLTAKMGLSGMRMYCKVLTIVHSFALEHLCCGDGGRKADSYGI